MFKSAGFHVEHLEEITKRHHLSNWARRQGCSDDMIAVLAQMLEDAPPVAAGWLQPEGVGTPAASFVNHHILIAGRKRLNMPA
jgi:hypothetical protein